jgi:high-affinity Fe2+/Pb2+ permease
MTVENIIAVIIAFFVLAWLVRGVIQTFKRQPTVAIILLLVLFPVYLIWALIEPFYWMADRWRKQNEELEAKKNDQA